MLDQMPELAMGYPPVQAFLQQIQDSGYIVQVHNRHLRRNPSQDFVDPSNGLPAWLQRPNSEIRLKSFTREEELELRTRFEGALESATFRDMREGRCFKVGERDENVAMPRIFKGYVSSNDLRKILENEDLGRLLENLKNNGVPASDLKLKSGDRLVFYFTQDIDKSRLALENFKALGINFRGPAQDVWNIVLNGKKLEAVVFKSNDVSLGEGISTPYSSYDVKSYSQVAFLESYLRMCVYTGKRPVNPYTTSFVYLDDPKGEMDRNNPKLLEDASKVAGYPVLYSQNRRAEDPPLFRK